MNREEIEKEFDEKFWQLCKKYTKPMVDLHSYISWGDKTVYWYSDSYAECTQEVKDFFLDEILPEILRDLVWEDIQYDDRFSAYKWNIEGSNERRKKIIELAKEKYNITL